MASPPQNALTSEGASGPRGSGRDVAELSEFEVEVISIFVELAQTLGLPKSYGEIYGLLFATVKPLSFAEIFEKLTLSKGSVSGGLRALKEIGAIHMVTSHQEQRDRYEPVLKLRDPILAYLGDRMLPQLSATASRMEGLDSLISEESGPIEDRRVLKSRISKLGVWRGKALSFIPWISRFLGK